MGNNNYKLYSEIQLAKDLPEPGFIKGDVATIVDTIIIPGKHKAYCLEFFDGHGKTLQVAVVGEDAIQLPREHVRYCRWWENRIPSAG